MGHQIQQLLHWNGLESKSVVLVGRMHAGHGYVFGFLSCLFDTFRLKNIFISSEDKLFMLIAG